jgi:hypothetical protein
LELFRSLGVPHVDAVEKDDLDIDAGRHLDDGLVLFGALDQIFADRVGGIAGALAEPAAENVAGRELRALPSALVVTPEKTLLALAEKPRPKPPTIPASSAWLTSGCLRG